MIFSEQLQCFHHLGIGTDATSLFAWAAILMPLVVIYRWGIDFATFSVGVTTPVVLMVKMTQSRRAFM